MKKWIILLLLLTFIGLPIAAAAEEPEGCTNLITGEFAPSPGQFPAACGPFELCILWGPGEECVETYEYQPDICAFTWEENGGEEHAAAREAYFALLLPYFDCVGTNYGIYIEWLISQYRP